MVRGKLIFFLLVLFLFAPWFWRPTIVAADTAQANYKELCVKCHGVSGKGNGPEAKTLNPRPADYTDCKKMTADSDDTLFKIIKGGSLSVGRSKEMPPWKEALSDEEIRDLVKYVRSFCKR
jgi:mono/diheme cytochrome c family protein